MIELLHYRDWAITESFFRLMAPRVLEALNQNTNVERKTFKDFESTITSLLSAIDPTIDKVAVTYDPWTGKEDLPTAKSGNKTIALIPISGALTKNGVCAYGMKDYGRFINMANANPDIHGIVLIIDSPGGSVDGTSELANIVKNSAKPVGVFGDGTVASAAFWIASQASVIIGNKNNRTEFGSIGTLAITEDISNVIEAGNHPKVKIHRAPQSTEKALVNPVEPITEEIQSTIDARLKMLTDIFIGEVKSGRGDKLNTTLEGLFKGRMFDSQTSKSNGLIDGIGTLQTTINKVAELARNNQSSSSKALPTNNGSQEQQQNMSLKTHVLGLLGFKSEQADSLSDEQAMKASEEKIAELQASLTGAVEAKAALEARISALETAAATHAEAVAAKDAEITQLKEAIAKPRSAAVTTVISDEEQEAKVGADAEGATTEKKNKYRTPTDDEADAYVKLTQPK
jgi:protease-4